MTATPTNPIAERLIHADRGPGPRASRVIGYGLGGAAGVLATLGMMTSAAPNVSMAWLFGILLAEALLLCACFVLAALIMLRARRADDSALLRQTQLPAGAIHGGYLQAIAYRLRIVRWAADVMPLGFALSGVAPGLWNPPAPGWSIVTVVLGAAVILALAAVYGYVTYKIIDWMAATLILAGVWLALRHPRTTQRRVTVVALLTLAFVTISLVAALNVTGAAYVIPAVGAALQLVLFVRERFFRADAIQAITAELGEGGSI